MHKENSETTWCLVSMTGCGRAQENCGVGNIDVIARSVNFRGLDVKCRMPHELSVLEPKIHHLVASHFSRGRIEIDVKVQSYAERLSSHIVDEDAALRIFASLSQLRERLQLHTPLTMSDVLAVPGIVRLKDNEEAVPMDALAEKMITYALADLAASRVHEGKLLHGILSDMLASSMALIRSIHELARGDVKNRFQRLKARLGELHEKFNMDEERLHQEFAILVERSDFTEELDRLHMHSRHFADLCLDGDAVGRKLDFLCQEMLRETNTLLSKASDHQITIKAIDLKAEIERIREQVQNIE